MINLHNTFKLGNFSKKTILLTIDISIIIFSIIFSYSLRLDFVYNPLDIDFRIYLIFVIVIIFSFYINNIYQILISFFDSHSILKIIKVVFFSQVILFFINIFLYKDIFFPRSISIIAPIIACILFVMARIIINYFINLKGKNINLTNNILIYGVNDSTFSLLNNLRSYPNYGRVVAFIDPKGNFKKRELSGIKIFKSSEFDNVIENYEVSEIIINSKNVTKNKINIIFKKMEKKNVRIRNLNEIKNSISIIKKSLETKPDFYDIIDRPKIQVDARILNKKIRNKSILVTGGGGSIGSELCLEILKHNPKKLFVLDNSEINLYNITKKIENLTNFNFRKIKFILGDCSDINFLKQKFKLIQIDDIYHAAAYKHVRFGEENFYSVIKNNILGTKMILELGILKNINNLIFISTDKAVNPKSVLGYTKKIGECLVHAYSKNTKFNKNTKFTIVRFGNVIGSSGSVIPLFLKQVNENQKLTVTHKNVKRYFMSIKEAVQLIINSSYLNKKKFSIYALEMGDQIKIIDIASRIIRLSGYSVKSKKNPNGDFAIKIIGLKKGEKMKEEISLGTNLKKTENKKIMLCDDKIVTFSSLYNSLNKKIDRGGMNLIKKLIS